MQYSVVIPTFNCGTVLLDICEKLNVIFEKNFGFSYEMIIVDDGSDKKESLYILAQLEKKTNVRVFRLKSNIGQQKATLYGLSKSIGHNVITMDDDGQHAPEDIEHFFLLKMHDAVIAELKYAKRSFLQKFLSMVKQFLDNSFLKFSTKVKFSAYRMFNRKTVNKLVQFLHEDQIYFPYIISKVTKDVITISIHQAERSQGNSGYNFGKSIRLIFTIFKFYIKK